MVSRSRRAAWRGFAWSFALLSLTRASRAENQDAPSDAPRAEEPAGSLPAAPAPAAPLGPPTERVHLIYALGSACPAADGFERELDARLGKTWKAAPGEPARDVTIAATEAGHITVVRMEYRDDDGRTLARSVSAPTCEEALTMMTVVTAVAIEAQLAKAAPKTAAAQETSPPVSRKARPEPPRFVPLTADDTAPPKPLSFEHEVGLRFGVSAGFGPSLTFGAGAEWGLVVGNSLELRAALEGRDTGPVPAADGLARFRALTARGDLCVATVHLTSWLGLPICAGLEAGVFWAEGVISPPYVTFTKSSYVPWFAALVTPRVRLSVLRAYLEMVPEIRLPLGGHTFMFELPDREAYTTPSVAFGVSLGAGVRFH